MTEISNADDVIDSRDIIARIEELQNERDDFDRAVEELREALDDLDDSDDAEAREKLREEIGKAEAALAAWDASDEAEELRILKALAEQCEGYGDWEYGETLIRRSYFVEYAQQLADDIGAVDHNAKWPLDHIDWEAAARSLKMDYASVDFDGVEYLMRA